ncbi:hypothetical protein GSI_00289 [Ganoderma sinense ZZ0214-1]|uniref:Uncharacterized protein n=1 Tax=Ganoderma sinense ZZ0214-1 TaxID=1077348 RepID=A0A2G8SS64_9APHY|nr:hypothetical protein GSI_00289 [Ganoderma sinense ZZ0214-1]
MRLIDTETGRFTEFFDLEKTPPYAILSHTWEPPPIGEQSYQDVVKIQETYRLSASDDDPPSDPLPFAPTIWDHDSGLSLKIRAACDVARRDGYRYIWIDSSCIDKASSSELSEAINSMCNWYRGAQVCYAFLADVPSNEDARAESSKFRKSRWFTRGWTLQELIAPRLVVFFSKEWEGLGTKDGLADLIQDITFIDRGVLTHEIALSDESVAERMRWAARRETTRVEDEAYSLLGIFEITMPTLYGEGRHAFRRLQEEILRRIPDQSLFAWGSVCLPIPRVPFQVFVDDGDIWSPFALSPRSFELSSKGKIIRASGPIFESLELPVEEYTHTPYGIRTQLCFLPLRAFNLTVSGVSRPNARAWCLAILASQKDDDPGRLLSRLCYIDYAKPNVNFLHVPERLQLSGTGLPWGHDSFIFLILLSDLLRATSMQLETRSVYLPHPEPLAAKRRVDGKHLQLKLSVSIWAKAALQQYGWIMSDIRHSTQDDPDTCYFALSSESFNVHVQYRHIVVDRMWLPMALVIEARLWILSPNHDEYDQSDIVLHPPPYASAVWTDEEPWAMTLPLRDVDVPTTSGDNVNLQLGLGLTAPSTYNVRVEVAATNVATRAGPELSTRASSKRLHMVLQGPRVDIKLTMLGSVRSALEAAGYVAELEGPEPNEGWYRSYSCSLRPITTASDSPKFTVLIKYFAAVTLRDSLETDDSQALVVAARVTLESVLTSLPSSNSSEAVWKDGPYGVVWTDRTPTWRWNHKQMQVCLVAPTGEVLTLHLGLDRAWQSEYYLYVGVERNASPSSLGHFRHLDGDLSDQLDGPCCTINLTLPGQVERSLRGCGYEVHFEGPSESHPGRYHLTLSSSSLTIEIEYFHDLSIDPVSEVQESTLRTCITLSSPRVRTSPADSDSNLETRVLEWDPWEPTQGWRWNLPKRDAEFTLTTGQKLTLCLGFYLAWPPEYCLAIEVSPLSPLSPPTSQHGRESGEG